MDIWNRALDGLDRIRDSATMVRARDYVERRPQLDRSIDLVEQVAYSAYLSTMPWSLTHSAIRKNKVLPNRYSKTDLGIFMFWDGVKAAAWVTGVWYYNHS